MVTVGEYSAKGLMLNISCNILFFSPFAVYARPERYKEVIYAILASFVVAWCVRSRRGFRDAKLSSRRFTPPVGWKKPHPLSDQPANRH